MREMDTYDVVIIGGGPAGLSAAVYAARAKLKTVVLDKNPAAGALGMARKIESFPGLLEAISGLELLSVLRKQAQKFGAVVEQTEVVGVDLAREPREVDALSGKHRGRAVIIATGSMGRKPTIEGEAALIGRGVAYCAACDAAFFEGKDVAMAGDLNLAIEELGHLARFARKVYLVAYGGEPTGEQRKAIAANPKVELIRGYRISRIVGKDSVQGLELTDLSGKGLVLNVSGVFLYLYGRLPVVDFLRGVVELADGECIKVSPIDMSTSVPGVYAIGDVTCRKLRQAVLAAAEGCIAALSAENYLSK